MLKIIQKEVFLVFIVAGAASPFLTAIKGIIIHGKMKCEQKPARKGAGAENATVDDEEDREATHTT